MDTASAPHVTGTAQEDKGKQVQVTRTYLPSLEEVDALLRGVWERRWVTNNGPLVQQMERRLGERLGTAPPWVLGNATLALQVAFKALKLSGEVITTPFSYVATTSALVWEGCTPVHVDIDPHTFNIDPEAIRAAIGPRTEAILATHVYGNACDVQAIERIAREKGLAVIYDAAHAFGSAYGGRSLIDHGDVSICSFHATKLYHSIEGGGLWCRDAAVRERSRLMRNFGHDGPERFNGVGINAKLSEMHAAVGIVMLDHMDRILARRAEQWDRYAKGLAGRVQLLRITEGTDHYNRSYFPAVFADEATLLRVDQALQAQGIFARRYFHPALNELPYVERRSDTPVCASISRRVLCLPLFHDLEPGTQDLTMETILANL